MASLSKINRIVREYTVANNVAGNYCVSIDPRDLDMPGGNMFGASGTRNGAYLVEVTCLVLRGQITIDGAMRIIAGCSYNNGTLYVSPGYPQTVQLYTSSQTATIGISQGTPWTGAIANNINVGLSTTSRTSPVGIGRYKLFIEIMAIGDDNVRT